MAKTKYDKSFPERAEAYAKQGYTDEQIFNALGISKDTFYKYQLKYPDFSDAIKRGKEPVDQEVETALLNSARGFEYEETTQEIKYVGGKEYKTVRKVKKRALPNVTSAIFWLVNRRPDRWRSINKDFHNDKKLQSADFDFTGIDDAS